MSFTAGILRIGVDIRDLSIVKTGQKTVMEEFYRQMLKNTDPSIEFIFFEDHNIRPTKKTKWSAIMRHITYQYWKQIVLPWKAYKHKCDIVFCGDYFVPLFRPGFKTVEILYDAFFFEYPEHYNGLWLKLFHFLAVPAAKKCDSIMVITEYARKKINQYMGIPMEKLICIYPSPKTFKYQNTNYDDQTMQRPIPQPYILHVGVMEKRKNLPMLVKAFDEFCTNGNTTHFLILAGQGNGKQGSDDTLAIKAAINSSSFSERIICTGYLGDAQVANMYKHADLYVFPSINEGFGIPILEAFQFNVPVLIANNSCLPEVGSDAVLTFNPYNAKELALLIERALKDDLLRAEMIAKGTQRLKDFSWEKSTQQLINLFKQTASNH